MLIKLVQMQLQTMETEDDETELAVREYRKNANDPNRFEAKLENQSAKKKSKNKRKNNFVATQ